MVHASLGDVHVFQVQTGDHSSLLCLMRGCSHYFLIQDYIKAGWMGKKGGGTGTLSRLVC